MRSFDILPETHLGKVVQVQNGELESMGYKPNPATKYLCDLYKSLILFVLKYFSSVIRLNLIAFKVSPSSNIVGCHDFTLF